MGAWVIGNFENEEAADWLYGPEQSQGLVVLLAALAPFTGPEDCLDAGDCTIPLAADENVAILKGRPALSLPTGASEWVRDQ